MLVGLVRHHVLVPFAFGSVVGLECAKRMISGAGVVPKAGSKVTKVKAGDCVVVADTSCGECKLCRKGETASCKDSFQDNFGGCRIDGSKAKHTLVHENGLVKIENECPSTKRLRYRVGT